MTGRAGPSRAGPGAASARRARAAVVAGAGRRVAATLGGGARSAVAQPAPATTTTSTTAVPPTTAPPTTAPPPTTTTVPPTTTSAPPTTAPPPSTPPPTALPPAGEPADDGLPEPVPTDPVPQAPPAPPGPDPATAVQQQTAAVAALTEIEGTLQEATTLRASAAQQVTNIEAELAALEASVTRLDANRQGALSQLRAARAVVQRRAVASYVVAPASQLNNVLDVVEFNELSRRIRMLAAVVRSDRSQIDAYEAAKDQAGAELAQLVDTVERTRSDLVAAQAFLRSVDEGVAARTVQLTAAQAASVLAPGGFVFPVSGPHTFTDTFGAPRMTGTPFAHTHQGADVFAPQGTPLVACERGVLIRIGTDLLGGTKLWLVGASGTRYYYAHLSAFAAGVVEGKVVQAGDVVGYVGNTGNAATTPAHLHFEAHPGGGPAINPYLLLRATDKPRS